MSAATHDLIDQLNIGVMLLDADGAALRANAAARIVLLADAQRGGKGGEDEHFQNALRELASRARREQRPLRAREISSGRHHVVDIFCTPLGDETLVELIPVEWHTRNAAAREARHRDAGLNAMLQGFAHEIRNPLSGMKGAIQLLMRGVDDGNQRQCCEVVLHEIDRLERLVGRLRTEDATPLDMEPVNVHVVTDRVIALSEGRAAATFHRDYDPSLPDLPGAPDALIQLLLNLVNNAIDAGADTITLRTRVGHGDGDEADTARLWAILSVVDNGPGIDDNLKEILFYPMVSGRTHGSGLGLAIAQRIARAHAGYLRLAETTAGAQFDLWLPLSRG